MRFIDHLDFLWHYYEVFRRKNLVDIFVLQQTKTAVNFTQLIVINETKRNRYKKKKKSLA